MSAEQPTTDHPRDRTLPAWVISVAIHVALLLSLAYLLRSVPRGAADEPGRAAGIVLKRLAEEGELYEGEEQLDEDEAHRPTPVSSQQLISALPEETSAVATGEALPTPPAIGPQLTGTAGLPNVADMTQSGGGGRRGGGGGEARVEVFGVEGVGNKFVYVFDRSISMDGAPLAAAKQQLVSSLQSLESIHQFQIVFFNHRLRVFDITRGQRRIAFATEQNKALAGNFVGGITADGGTDRAAALSFAINLHPDVIFFLTDADDPMPSDELSAIARRNRRGQASINTIEFGRGPAHRRQNFLVHLARASGGQYGYVDTTQLRRSP